MEATEIVEAVKSIPEKKENLREAFETLQSSFSSLSSSSSILQWKWKWKDVEDHISSIETSILDRFSAALRQTTTTTTITTTATDDDNDGGGSSNNNKKKSNLLTPKRLKSFCINMDFKGLRSCFIRKRNRRTNAFLASIRDDLSLALRSAPDPALLILNAMYGFNPRKIYPQTYKVKGELLNDRTACIYLLEILYPISLEFGIKPIVRERALRLAVEWKYQILENDKSMETATQALGFLRLLVAYGLVQAFEADYVMDLLCVCIWRRSADIDLVKNLGLVDKAHDLIRKLNRKARELDAVKIVCTLNISDKFPPVPLLKAYITRSKQRADELRKKGNNSAQTQNDATVIEMSALVSVLNVIKGYKLESEYPPEGLIKRMGELDDQKKADKKQAAASVAASNSKAQREQQSKECPHPSPATAAPVIAANSYPQPIQPHPQHVLAEPAPRMGLAGPCGQAASGSVYNHSGPSLYGHLAAIGSVYNHGGPSLSCITMDQGATRSSPSSYYSSESLAGTSRLYDRSVTYHDRHLDGLPSSYGSSLYP